MGTELNIFVSYSYNFIHEYALTFSAYTIRFDGFWVAAKIMYPWNIPPYLILHIRIASTQCQYFHFRVQFFVCLFLCGATDSRCNTIHINITHYTQNDRPGQTEKKKHFDQIDDKVSTDFDIRKIYLFSFGPRKLEIIMCRICDAY